jgi:hypothetical protein
VNFAFVKNFSYLLQSVSVFTMILMMIMMMMTTTMMMVAADGGYYIA